MNQIIVVRSLFFIFFAVTMFAQESALVLHKPGDFRITKWSMYTCSDCNYTKTEERLHYSNMLSMTDVLRKNPVLEEIKGFDCNVMLYSEFYGNKKHKYGIPGKMSVQFCYYFINDKGKTVPATIEPPDFDIHINQLWTASCNSLGFTTRDNVIDADNPNFNKNKWEDAAEVTREMFFSPGKKETIVSGIDVYANETVIIYNPDKPDYWLPVTIKEIFEAWIEYYKYEPNIFASEMTLKMLEDEYALFSESEKNNYAFLGGRGSAPILNVDTDVNDVQVMKFNSKYWNTILPKSAIQLLSFSALQDKDRLNKEAEEKLKINSGSYHLTRFLESFDLKSLLSVIDK